jgi:hypothetical protein
MGNLEPCSPASPASRNTPLAGFLGGWGRVYRTVADRESVGGSVHRPGRTTGRTSDGNHAVGEMRISSETREQPGGAAVTIGLPRGWQIGGLCIVCRP